jgi:hypothetical protein
VIACAWACAGTRVCVCVRACVRAGVRVRAAGRADRMGLMRLALAGQLGGVELLQLGLPAATPRAARFDDYIIYIIL